MKSNQDDALLFETVKQARALRERFLSDRYRPGYHYVAPEDIGIPGDPNGIFYSRGRYHMMYLYANCTDGFRWGHLSSIDMVHWRAHPDVLLPDETDGGIFSGGAYVDDDGTAWICYWALPREGENAGGIRLAKSSDRLYETWEKIPGYVIRSDEFGVTRLPDGKGGERLVGSADPSNIWRSGEFYYMQTGNLPVLNKFRDDPTAPEAYRGDHTYLFRSKDLIHWEYCHEFYQRDTENRYTDESEDNMCPCFLPLPARKEGGELTDTYLELFIAHNKGCQYYLGEYDQKEQLFRPGTHGRMSWCDNAFFAPEAILTADNRLVMWSWLIDNLPDEEERAQGWSGVFGLPRQLWKNEDGSLGIAPLAELEQLRYSPTHSLEALCGDSCEIDLTFEMASDGKAGLKVLSAPDGSEYTLVYYDASEKNLVMDTRFSGKKGRCALEKAPLALKEGEPLRLRVFLDKTVVEVFANDRQAITRRVYTSREDSLGLSLYTEGASKLLTLDGWDMMPSNFC